MTPAERQATAEWLRSVADRELQLLVAHFAERDREMAEMVRAELSRRGEAR